MATLQTLSQAHIGTTSPEHDINIQQQQFQTNEKLEIQLEAQQSETSRMVTSSESDILNDDGFDYPENNVRGWLVVLGAFFGLIPTWGLANSLGVIQTQVLEHQLASSSTTTVSWVFSIYTCLEMVSNVFSGRFFDRNGVLWPLLVGTTISVGSLLGVANATTVYQFVLAFGVGFGD
ncbi:unnamed protein product [Ambrosiozyma monospora]|uniref:Unnamed protein product n=1 Tax=Ambrosiozyma monospora TaxID=43982 RepID=A0ACB5U773_AMBMO|nr:unnamed protein product [Ambrosiozyma monospora]